MSISFFRKKLRKDQSEEKDSLTSWISHPGLGLFLASFLSLFLELLLIRWVPSLVRIVAYYGNLMLLSSFLGLGCGLLLAGRRLDLQQWFAPCFLLLVFFITAIKGINFQQGPDELRFLFKAAPTTTMLPILFIFIFNALLFVPLGDLIGSYFHRLPPLQAYSWDLAGAIAGTLLFGLFSFFWFSPILGCIIIMVLYLNFCRGSLRLPFTGTLFITSLCIMLVGSRDIGIWSPYNHISVKKLLPDGRQEPIGDPVSNIGTMRDPPFFVIQVNHDFYMVNGTIDNLRYTDSARGPLALREQYSLPYLIRPGVKDVLVVGSGGGVDVEAALLHGAERVDAVEIDPVIIEIGHQYNASQSYKDPRVSIHNTDARAFFKQTNKAYDMIVFGFLDSQGLFSQMSNIRLDGYVYTRESFQEAFRLLRMDGLMSISFFSAGKEWLISRLISMVHSATGMDPLVYVKRTGQITVLAGKEFSPTGPQRFISYQRIDPLRSATLEAVDDWPYLYLRDRFIPLDYLITIGLLLAISLLFILFSLGNKGRGVNLHFFFLGAGFLLLETKSITTVSLYFGATWLVSMLVILGVLFMVLLANLVASKSTGSLIFYCPLIASIAFLYIFPAQTVLGWSFLYRLMYSLVIIPLPIFFAGLIFSTTFRETGDPSLSFGSNLLGAMVGGFAEYLGMVTGTRTLLLIVIVFYLASLMVRLRFAEALSSRA